MAFSPQRSQFRFFVWLLCKGLRRRRRRHGSDDTARLWAGGPKWRPNYSFVSINADWQIILLFYCLHLIYCSCVSVNKTLMPAACAMCATHTMSSLGRSLDVPHTVINIIRFKICHLRICESCCRFISSVFTLHQEPQNRTLIRLLSRDCAVFFTLRKPGLHRLYL